MTDLRVVENLHEGTNPKVASLYDRLNAVITDHVENCPTPVTTAEVVGTLEILKLAHAKVYDT